MKRLASVVVLQVFVFEVVVVEVRLLGKILDRDWLLVVIDWESSLQEERWVRPEM